MCFIIKLKVIKTELYNLPRKYSFGETTGGINVFFLRLFNGNVPNLKPKTGDKTLICYVNKNKFIV